MYTIITQLHKMQQGRNFFKYLLCFGLICVITKCTYACKSRKEKCASFQQQISNIHQTEFESVNNIRNNFWKSG